MWLVVLEAGAVALTGYSRSGVQHFSEVCAFAGVVDRPIGRHEDHSAHKVAMCMVEGSDTARVSGEHEFVLIMAAH